MTLINKHKYRKKYHKPRQATPREQILAMWQQWTDILTTSPDGQHQNQTDYILCSQRRRSSIQSAKMWLKKGIMWLKTWCDSKELSGLPAKGWKSRALSTTLTTLPRGDICLFQRKQFREWKVLLTNSEGWKYRDLCPWTTEGKEEY